MGTHETMKGQRRGSSISGGFSLIGGRRVEAADVPADAPVLRVRNWSVVGGVRVRVAR